MVSFRLDVDVCFPALHRALKKKPLSPPRTGKYRNKRLNACLISHTDICRYVGCNTDTYSALISACEQGGQMGKVLRLANEMQVTRVDGDAVCNNQKNTKAILSFHPNELAFTSWRVSGRHL